MARSSARLTLAAAAFALLLAPSAGATEPHDLAALLGTTWPGFQRPDGTFRDYVPSSARGRDRYGEAMLGYALLDEGIRDKRPAAVRSGLLALRYAATHVDRDKRAVFANLALASAYNLARERLAGDPLFLAVRPLLERRLKRISLLVLGGRRPYYNYAAVEAIAVLELARSGLGSGAPGSVLANRRRALALVRELVNRTMPRLGRLQNGVISDPPLQAPAYEALTFGLLTRAVRLLGSGATAAARRTLDRTARTMWMQMAPDGDVAYTGRSQEQSWTLAMTACGAAQAERLPGLSRSRAGEYRALAQRALARLRAVHGGEPYGVFITPALMESPRFGVRGLDDYASGVPYTGLTLVGLNWALDELGRGEAPDGGIGSDSVGGAKIGTGVGSFAVLRAPSAWFAVRLAPAVRDKYGIDYTRDLRFDSGLVALKALEGGTWHDVLRLRPLTSTRLDSAGPLLRARGRTGRPVGRSLRVSGRTVVWTGGYQLPSGRWLRRGLRVRYEATSCGARVRFPALARDDIEYSVFFRRKPTLDLRDLTLSDGSQLVRLSERPLLALEDGYASGLDPALTRARMRFRGSRRRTISIEICAR